MPTRSAIQWWQITPEGTIQQMGRIDDATGGSFFAYPSIAVNKNLDVLLGYSRFSASEFASAAYSFRAGTDPAGTLRGEVLLKVGEAPYFKVDGENSNRWGDYSNTVVDPANDEDFWTIQEYAAPPVAGVDRWGTWWGRIVPPAPETSFVRGDVGGDGSLNLADAIAVLSYLFRGGSLGCLKSADADGNGTIDITDPIYMITCSTTSFWGAQRYRALSQAAVPRRGQPRWIASRIQGAVDPGRKLTIALRTP